jgi:hypothetical protein
MWHLKIGGTVCGSRFSVRGIKSLVLRLVHFAFAVRVIHFARFTPHLVSGHFVMFYFTVHFFFALAFCRVGAELGPTVRNILGISTTRSRS